MMFKMIIVVWSSMYTSPNTVINEEHYPKEKCQLLAPLVEQSIEANTGWSAKVACIPVG